MNRSAVALLVLGLLQMSGDVLEHAGLPMAGRPLKGIGAASAASPAPKVFSAVRGFETYSSRFALEWTDARGAARVLEITPEVYGRLRGPYNRRNVYGAALAYGPVLAGDPRTRPLFDAVAGYAFTGEAPLLRELGVDPGDVVGPIRIRYEPLAAGGVTGDGGAPPGMPLVLEVPRSL